MCASNVLQMYHPQTSWIWCWSCRFDKFFSSVPCLSCPIHWCQSLVPVLLHDSFYILLHVQDEDILFIFSLVPEEVGLTLSGIWVHHIYFLSGMAFCDSVSLHLTCDSWTAHKHLVSQPHYTINSHELNVTHAFCFSSLCPSLFSPFELMHPLKALVPLNYFSVDRQF